MLLYQMEGLWLSVGELGIVYLLYRKASETYDYIRVMEFGFQYESYIKMVDLLLNIVIQAHIFVSLTLGRPSSSSAPPSWTTKTTG